MKNIYFIGIGGVGMSSLAMYFLHFGKEVMGYDRVSSDITDMLMNKGVRVHFQEDLERVYSYNLNRDNTLIVITPAIMDSHKELIYFKNEGFKIIKRAEVLGEISRNTTCMAIAGTHGKTTTSAILGHIMEYNKMPNTSFIGGITENYNSNLILRGDKYSVVEADEFDRSFLRLHPKYICVTSMDADHLDIYGDKKGFELSFREFADKVSDKKNVLIREGLPLEGSTYGVNDFSNFRAYNVCIKDGSYIFDVDLEGEVFEGMISNLPGIHNIENSLAAIIMAYKQGISLNNISEALEVFRGIKRRFSYHIKNENLTYIDDYAHHPKELEETINTVRHLYPKKKVLGVFQPHLFSRTRDFADGFGESLSRLDQIILLDIYPARELPIEGIDSSWLLNKVRIKDKKVLKKEELIPELKNRDFDVLLTLGAGADIGEMVPLIKREMSV
ncbi:UDP-N-acetylmuramate--L-alanine ligase [Ichthyobacterium seriolicida]|uniref:UDP-N-acetylmuramate--L-alanine ligase n=1 Tax=Ichthyobacterium seriolicida TaxID=242600 RepID=A0A1J1E5B9_9FLAO|nr:UDP-N-acetylmuramate--L-alanine ligase [Ichthyobacterium seriolicida]BAV95252.1 UDP-N-acetylmuramate--alanine ligase [Ichthyobacterium seriolicida]